MGVESGFWLSIKIKAIAVSMMVSVENSGAVFLTGSKLFLLFKACYTFA